MKTKPANEIAQKAVVITGASSGAGRAAAIAFPQHHATLILAARRYDILLEVAEECEMLGGTVLCVSTDVTDAAALKELANKAITFAGRIDVWINNAGVLAAGEFDSTPLEIHEQVININLMGYIYGAYAVLPLFKKQGYGVLINNISVGGWFPTPFAAAYTASKFALRGFSESVRAELMNWKNIHVCDLYPAFLDTPGIQHAANYTGKVLRPAPPVYNPERVARAMLRLSVNPQSKTTTDIAAPMLKLSYSLFPSLSMAITSRIMRRYFKAADDIKSTSGNTISPVKYGSGVSGGWNYFFARKAASPAMNTMLILGGLSLVMALLHKEK